MFIKRISILNYRNFGNPPFIIDLHPFTLILGENNIGKTNLLNALGLIFSQEITVFRKRTLELDDINYQSVKTFKTDICNLTKPPEGVQFPIVQIDAWITDMNEEQRAIAGNWAIDKDLVEAQITYIFSPKPGFNKVNWILKKREWLASTGESPEKWMSLLDFPIGDYRYSIYVGNNPERQVELSMLQMFRMEILEALRDATKELVASNEYRLLFRILNQRSDIQFSDIKQTLEDLEKKINKNENLLEIKNSVEILLNRVSLKSPNQDNSIGFNFSSIETSEILKKLGLVYGIEPIEISRNGLGRNNLLYIALLLSQLAAKDIQGDETWFRLIAVEEPESHLHPQLQDHLSKNIENIRNETGKSMQLLLTTHSSHIAAKLSIDNSVIIFRDAKNNSLNCCRVISTLDKKTDADSIKYLKKFLDSTKSKIFFSRKLILVEGSSEQFLIPILFRSFRNNSSSLEQEGIELVNVNGLAFSHFLKLLRGGFFIRSLVLTDSDAGTKTENRAGALKAEFDQPGLILIEISSHSTFEKDIIEANKSGAGKNILLETLKEIKPKNGKSFEEITGTNEIDVESFFKEIAQYKTEFSFALADQLEKDSTKFKLPDYIINGFTELVK